MVEISLNASLSRGASCLSSGFDDPNQFLMPVGNRKVYKRVIYLPELTNHFRWDLDQEITAKLVSSFKISKISKRFACKMFVKKLKANGAKASQVETLGVDELYSIYDDIFASKVKQKQEYNDWLKGNEVISELTPNISTCISILMPVYNPPIEYFELAIQSVLAQTYSNWELCIADDCSTNFAVRLIIEKYAKLDSRIKYVFRPDNGNISLASNSALSLASGQYIALMDHDDLIPPHSLNEIALSFIDLNLDIIYTDEDKVDLKGVRFEPNFKSDFNVELILSHNYISHFGVYKRELVEKVGGFRVGFEGSQDYDLLLRCIAQTTRDRIKHIPKVLYHWRAIDGSTALSNSQKNYTSEAGVKALHDYIKSQSNDWEVEQGELPNTYRVNRPIKTEPLVSIIIPTKDQKDVLETCIESILNKTNYANYNIVVVDNGSQESTTKSYFNDLSLYKNIKILSYDKPFNYSAINNYAVSQVPHSDYVLLLNNDVEVINRNWLAEMVSVAKQSDVGCVGAKLYYSNSQIQHAGVILGVGGVAGHSHKYFNKDDNGYFSRLKVRQDISAVTAACLLVARDTYMEVFGLDEENLTVAFNDVDFCLKVRGLGLRNVWTPFAELYHYESLSRGAEDTPEKVKRFNQEVEFMKSKWGESLLNDPFYNPNLTLIHEDFSLR